MTAAVRIHLSRLAANCRFMQQRSLALGKTWVPEMPPGTPEGVLKQVFASGVRLIACRDRRTAQLAASMDFQSVWLLSRVTGWDEIKDLADNDPTASIVCSADHFVHLERLNSVTLQGGGLPRSVLLEVDAGQPFCGLQPGREVCLLAKSTLALPGIRLAGLLLRFDVDPEPADDRPATATTADALSALAFTHTLLVQEIGPCASVAIRGNRCDGVLDGRELLTHWVDPLSAFGGPGCLRMVDGKMSPALTLDAVVVSRPSLNVAIIGVGIDQLGSGSPLPEVTDIAGATAIGIRDHSLAIRLQGAARDLTIGDCVQLALPPSAAVLAHAGDALA